MESTCRMKREKKVMSEKPAPRKKQPGMARPYKKVTTLRYGSAIAEIIQYQAPLGLNRHLYRPKRVFEVMTTGKEDDSELIAPETTDDLISVSNKAKAYCEALDRGEDPAGREGRVNGHMKELEADTTSSQES